MKVTGERESVELCTEAGWSAVDLMTDEPVDRETVLKLGKLGTLTYLSMLRQPFYRVESNFWLVKGLEGEKTLRVSMAGGEEDIIRRVRDCLEDDVSGPQRC